jgi:hypothetical protein
MFLSDRCLMAGSRDMTHGSRAERGGFWTKVSQNVIVRVELFPFTSVSL